MAAWAVSDNQLERENREPGEPGRVRSWSGSVAAACAEPTCTCSTVTCRRGVGASFPGTRWWAGWVAGPGATRFSVGDRVGVAWLASTDGTCRFCRRGAENLCLAPSFTGWDRDGGYADYCLADEAYAYALPGGLDDEQAAPLLCAGIIGYRALGCAAIPAGGTLGIYGFGGSAPDGPIAIAQGLRVHVRTRGAGNRELAAQLGAATVGEAAEEVPEPLDGAILFAPAGELAGDHGRA